MAQFVSQVRRALVSAASAVSIACLVSLAAGGRVAATEFGSLDVLHLASAGEDMEEVRRHVEALAELSAAHVETVGLERAIEDFVAEPWRREANGLHVWGVTRDGVSWFDAGHPELVGLDVSEMTDIEGRNWSRLAWASASGEGDAAFTLVFPHPITLRARRSVHKCYLADKSDRVLCAGAFEDRDQ